ncbi:MAG: hypothetical protein V1913_14350, partial [Fibrobacterota bacterium]
KKKKRRSTIERIEVPPIVRDKTPNQLMETLLAFRANDFTAANLQPMTAAALDYRAVIRKQASYVSPRKPAAKAFRNVTIVTSTLSWHHHCGAGCGLTFSGKKSMVFNSKGDILDIQTESESAPESAQ